MSYLKLSWKDIVTGIKIHVTNFVNKYISKKYNFPNQRSNTFFQSVVFYSVANLNLSRHRCQITATHLGKTKDETTGNRSPRVFRVFELTWWGNLNMINTCWFDVVMKCLITLQVFINLNIITLQHNYMVDIVVYFFTFFRHACTCTYSFVEYIASEIGIGTYKHIWLSSPLSLKQYIISHWHWYWHTGLFTDGFCSYGMSF